MNIYVLYPESEIENKWIIEFIKNLEFTLSRVLDIKTNILRKGHEFNSINKNEYSNSNSLFIFFNGIQNKYDPEFYNELSVLEENINNNGSNFTNTFNICMTPELNSDLPNGLKQAKQYNFYFFTSRRNILKYLEFDSSKSNAWDKIMDIANDIKSIVANNNKQIESKLKYIVYLGRCSNDLQISRDKIQRELKQRNCIVLPEKEISDINNDIIYKQLEDCSLIIQVIGGQYGTSSNNRYSNPELENRIIEEFLNNNKDLKRLIWFPANLKSIESRQQLFINKIKNKSTGNNTEIIESNIEQFKSILPEKLQEQNDKKFLSTKEDTEVETLKKQVYLISKQNNQSDLIKKYAIQFKIDINNFVQEQNEISYLQYLESIATFDNILIDNSNNDSIWLDSKLKDLVKAIGMDRKKTHKYIGIIGKVEPENYNFSFWLKHIQPIRSNNAADLINFFEKIRDK